MANNSLISMTGYGKAVFQNSDYQLECQIRTVNSRFLDLQIRIPKDLLQHESQIRKLLSENFSRGRVELNLIKTEQGASKNVSFVDSKLFAQQLKSYRKLLSEQRLQVSDDVLFQQILSNPALSSTNEVAASDITASKLMKLVQQTIAKTLAMRVKEGAGLLKLVKQAHLDLFRIKEQLSKFVNKDVGLVQRRLQSRITELLGDHQLDPQRLANEVAYLAERADVSEELNRLTSHLDHFAKLISSKLDGKTFEFLLQELQREFNTLNSKSQNIKIANLIINAKAIIEKMREQAQNIE